MTFTPDGKFAMPSDIERIEQKIDMLIQLMLRIAPADLDKQRQWAQEVADLKAGRKIRRNGNQIAK